MFCSVFAESTHPGLTASTDQQEYTNGEIIRVNLENHFTQSIYSHIRSATPVFCIQFVEKQTAAGDWEQLFAQCQPPVCEHDIDLPGEIKSGEVVSMNWNPLVYRQGSATAFRPWPGVYRLSILYEDCNKTEWQAVYTNEFSIQ
jgi:hypothetical protein